MKFSLKSSVFLILLLGAGFALYAYMSEAEPVQYITAPVQYNDIEQTVVASGTLNAVNQVSVGSQVSGQLKSLKVQLGDHVEKGQLVAEIDPELNQNTLKQAQANLDSVKAQKKAKEALLNQYRLAYQRQQRMWLRDATSKADLENAEASMATTQAEIHQLDAEIISAQVSVETAKANLGYTQITSPISGTVISVVTKEGQTVQASQSIPTIIKVADLDTMTVKAEISEADVIHVKPGMPVYFTVLGEPDKKYHATLRAIEPASTSDSSDDSSSSSSSSSSNSSSSSSSAIYYNGLFDIENPDHRLRVSMTAQVTIITAAEKHVLTIPVSALDNLGGRYFVRVLKNSKTEPREIEIGLKDSLSAQIISGLSENETVIIGDSTNMAPPSNDGHMMPPPPGM